MLVDNGFCHWHLRRDGQLTIREIISTKSGAGNRILERLKRTIGATSLYAKCPANLPANVWYYRRGFHVERMEVTPSGRKLLCWRLWLKRKPQPNANGVEVIYCAAGNKRFAEIAIDAGMHTGAQLPATVYYQPYFVDQNWKNPNREKYMAELAKYTPYMATVLDYDSNTTHEEVMSWANEASQYVQVIVIIPKVWGTIDCIPHTINGKPVRLGYSVPTTHGGTDVPLSEFSNRPVHLLGGSPEDQIELAKFLNVKSIDNNYIQKMAAQYCQYWSVHIVSGARNKIYPTLREVGIGGGNDAIYRAFEISCRNIMTAWRERDIVRLPLPAEQLRLAI